MAEPVKVEYWIYGCGHGWDPKVKINRDAFRKFSEHVESSWVVEDPKSLQGAIKRTLLLTLAELEDQVTSDFMMAWKWDGVAPCSKEHVRAAYFAWTWFISDPARCPDHKLSQKSDWEGELSNGMRGEVCIVDKHAKRRKLVPDTRETKDTI